MTAVMGIDAGTTGVRAMIVDEDAKVISRAYREFAQHFPQPGWVEHDAEEIWQVTTRVMHDAIRAAGTTPEDLAAVGVTNQRETVVAWDRDTLTPLHRALVWQDRRTAGRCDELRQEIQPRLRAATGLLLDPYFSATKIEWLLENVSGLRERVVAGDAVFGTIDSWILARLTNGAVHATDASNASRTLLYDIVERRWSKELLDLFGVPEVALPEVRPSSGRFGMTFAGDVLGASIPVSGVAGDQQAALFGQGCFTPGMTKNTYGTGSFVLMNVGTTVPPPAEGILTTIAWEIGDDVTYALEGSIFITGAAVQWLRDGLGIIADASETGPLAASVPDTAGVVFVPALTGLGSPYWDPYARGAIVGLTRGTTRAHLVRATVEAMAYQTRDVVDAMAAHAHVRPTELRVDGGASVMDFLCQFQADLLGVVVRRPVVQETTVLGAAFMAGLAEGVWTSTQDIARTWQVEAEFAPAQADPAGYERWLRAVERARGWET